MDMFHMPHGQSFGYRRTLAALTDWLVRHQEVERWGANSHVRLAATLAQSSSWRIERQWGWVAEISGCIAGCAHPLEKSGLSFVDTSIHRLRSAEVWIR